MQQTLVFLIGAYLAQPQILAEIPSHESALFQNLYRAVQLFVFLPCYKAWLKITGKVICCTFLARRTSFWNLYGRYLSGLLRQDESAFWNHRIIIYHRPSLYHYHQFHTADHHYGKEGFPECYINLCTFLEFDHEELIDGIGYSVVKKCMCAQLIQSMMNASLWRF